MQSQTMADGRAWLDANELLNLGTIGGYSRIVPMLESSNVFLLSAVEVLKQKWIWEDSISPITDEAWENIKNGLNNVQGELMTNLAIGTIFWSVSILNDDNIIIPLGQTLLQSDYTEFTLVAPASWIVGTNIQLPNMVMTGLIAGTSIPSIGVITGENTVVLSQAEMPSHTHTQNPHTHTDIIPSVTPTGAGPIVAGASLVLPTPSITGASVAVNNNSGGDVAHNNVQLSVQAIPYLVVR